MSRGGEKMADKNTTSNINLAAAEELPKAQSKFKEFVKKFMKRKTAVISLAFIVFIILMAIIGPYVVPYDPQAPDYTAMMQGPSAAHIWGTNEYGQDVFSRLMVGTRLSLTCALTATIIGTAIGVVLGLIAGFYGGLIDSLIIGILCFILMHLFKLPYELLISVIIGVTNVIPFFGPFIGAAPCAILVFLISPKQCLYFIGLILVLQQFDGNILGPKILGNSTGVSSFGVLFSILLFGGLFGFVGMIIAVPLMAVIIHVYRQIQDHFLAKKNLSQEENDYVKLDRIDEKSGEYIRRTDKQ